ncbi:MAG: ABC transporter ATP-binding protein [Armatimonadetes bacterium]|nr:ABC transporter ATP-binding protein [Armatimonadota bacterium]
MPVASANDLTVKYGRKPAVTGLTVTIPEGSVGLLGPNGAGKTTLIKTWLGFLRPYSGSASVLGMSVAQEGLRIRRHIGLMPEQDCHIPGMNAVSYVSYAGELAGMPANHAMRRAHEVLEYCGLGEARYRQIETYSTGMRQRIKLAQALVHGPRLLFLDEPTNGLDPEGRTDMLRLVRDISHGKDINVVVCSHLLPDVEDTCDRVIVMRSGQLVAEGTVAALRRTGGVQVDVELREPSPRFLEAIALTGARVISVLGSRCRLAWSEQTTDPATRVFEAAAASEAQVRALKPALRSLEDVFMEAIA